MIWAVTTHEDDEGDQSLAAADVKEDGVDLGSRGAADGRRRAGSRVAGPSPAARSPEESADHEDGEGRE